MLIVQIIDIFPVLSRVAHSRESLVSHYPIKNGCFDQDFVCMIKIGRLVSKVSTSSGVWFLNSEFPNRLRDEGEGGEFLIS